MKKILLCFIFFISSFFVFCGEISSKVEIIKEPEYKISLNLHLKSGIKKLKNITYDEYSSILVTNDEKYLIISSGTDVIGWIEIYDISNMRKIVSEGLRSYNLNLSDNTLVYIACKWSGDDYSICETHIFFNGKITVVNQYVGSNNRFGSPYPALSLKYKLSEYDINNCLNYFKNLQTYYEGIKVEKENNYYSPIEIRKLLINTKLPKNDATNLSKNDINIFMDYCITATQLLIRNYSEPRFECATLFNSIYPIIDFYNSRKIISNEELNSYVEKYLSLLKINTETVPWLLKK